MIALLKAKLESMVERYGCRIVTIGTIEDVVKAKLQTPYGQWSCLVWYDNEAIGTPLEPRVVDGIVEAIGDELREALEARWWSLCA